jgi:hypothetical protein
MQRLIPNYHLLGVVVEGLPHLCQVVVEAVVELLQGEEVEEVLCWSMLLVINRIYKQ